MILLEPAYKILHTPVKFKRRTISVTPFSGMFVFGIQYTCGIRPQIRRMDLLSFGEVIVQQFTECA
jgi:hypothetical protein